MIGDSGIEALTMQRLAASLGLTAGALYRYFRSKAEIISALERQVLRELSERLETELSKLAPAEAPEDAALCRLWLCAHFYLRQGSERPEQAGLITMLLADPQYHVHASDLPGVSADFISIFGQLVNQMAAAEECGALSPGNAQRRALVFWSSLQGVCSLSKLRRVDAEFFDPIRAGGDLVRALLQGWGANPQRIAEQEQCAFSFAATNKNPRKSN